MKLLLAEDEKDLSNALVAILKHQGYTVDFVYDGQDALEYILASEYDGIILDIMMPGLEGTKVLEKIREKGVDTPVLFLTAKSEIEDKIYGLDLGADDYLTKPFEMGELLARIRAMTRRKGSFSPSILKCGNLELDRSSHELKTASHDPVKMSGREFQMLEMMMENPSRVFSVDVFMDKIWADGEADINVVWVYISSIRKKLAALKSNCEIKASRGVGYSLHIKDNR